MFSNIQLVVSNLLQKEGEERLEFAPTPPKCSQSSQGSELFQGENF